MAAFDDSDMKIVPDDPSEVFDTGEGAACAFTRETSNGNMEKAKILGKAFAAELLAGEQGLVYFGVGAFDDGDTLAQRQTLFAYIVNCVIEDMAPNSIVAQSALSSFYETVHSSQPEICEQISDSTAFTIYILAHRQTPTDPCSAGRAFAQLCGHTDDDLFERYGCELAEYYALQCTQMVLRAELIR